MKDQRATSQPGTINVRLFYSLFGLLIGWEWWTAVSKGDSPLTKPPFAWAMLWLIDWLMTIPHELGHALTGKLFGFKNTRVVIGYGEPVWSGRTFGFPWVFNRWPFGGFTLYGQDSTPQRWQMIAAIAAGPAVSALAMLGAWLYLQRQDEFPTLRSWSGIFFWANAGVLVQNSFPYYANFRGVSFANDGMLILKVLFPGRFLPTAPNDLDLAKRSQILKWISSFFLGLLTVLIGILTVGIFSISDHKWSEPGMFIWGVSFAFLTVWLGYKTFRLAREPFVLVQEPRHAEDVQSPEMEALMANSLAVRHSSWARFCAEMESASTEGKLALIDKHQGSFPMDAVLLGIKSHHLSELGRHTDADEALIAAMALPISTEARRVLMMSRIYQLTRAGAFETIEVLCEETFARADAVKEKIDVVEAFVGYHLYEEKFEKLDRLEAWTRRALELQPNNASVKATLGGVLVEQGRFAEAEPLLAPQISEASNLEHQAYSLFFIAIIRAAEGKRSEAKQMIERALILSDTKWLVKRTTKILARLAQSDS